MVATMKTTLPSVADRYTVIVRGLIVMCSIGIRPEEQDGRQRVRVSVELSAAEGAPFPGESRRRVINYEKVVAAIHAIAESGHIDLCEGFADRLATACFADPRVARVRITVEKLDVFPDAEGVGAILERHRPMT
jgi:7,8-dihydroneopterin aldolase/epimerase/oxygenase